MKILLHICCGPCSIYPIIRLREMGHQLTGYFFNPNIHPYKEHQRRLDTLKEYSDGVGIPLRIDGRYLLEEFLSEAMRPDRDRCEGCYELRFRQAAVETKLAGCEALSTTLLVSPYQKHDLIRQVGERIAMQEGVGFLYEDFRPGWHEGVTISRERQMYRQPYCGCIFSERDRYDKNRRDA